MAEVIFFSNKLQLKVFILWCKLLFYTKEFTSAEGLARSVCLTKNKYRNKSKMSKLFFVSLETTKTMFASSSTLI